MQNSFRCVEPSDPAANAHIVKHDRHGTAAPELASQYWAKTEGSVAEGIGGALRLISLHAHAFLTSRINGV
eukprot:11258274-Alexandrium_andersonii.AAC.1